MLFVAAILVAVLLLAVQVERGVGRELDERAATAASSLQREVDSHVLTLAALRGLVLAQPDLRRRHWQSFLSAIAPLHRLNTARGFGFARAAKRGNADFVSSYLGDYGIDRGMTPAGGTGAAFPIVILEPDDVRNRAALGFDMYSEAVRREAMNRAARSGGPAVTGTVRLKQEVEGPIQNGFLIYMPVRTKAGRLEGFVYAPYRVNDFFRATATSLVEQGFGLRVRGPEGTLLFELGPTRGHRWDGRLQLADQSWPVSIIIPRPALSGFAAAVLLLGLGIASVVAALLIQHRRRLTAVETLASERERHLAETDLLMREMAHRLKNVFARIVAIAHLTGRQSADMPQFLKSFGARLEALARSKEMLMQGTAQEGSLRDMVVQELGVAAVEEPERMVEGDGGTVGAGEYWVAALCVHELVTNSIKYGALAKGGQLTCRISTGGGERSILWHERLAERVETGIDGFGSDFVATMLARNLRGRVERRIDGCEVHVELAWPTPAEALPATAAGREPEAQLSP